MPRIKAAKKALRQSRKRGLKNRAQKRGVYEAIKELERLVKAGQKEDAQKKLPEVQSAIDRAAKHHLFHRNKAARKKSQLAKLLK